MAAGMQGKAKMGRLGRVPRCAVNLCHIKITVREHLYKTILRTHTMFPHGNAVIFGPYKDSVSVRLFFVAL